MKLPRPSREHGVRGPCDFRLIGAVMPMSRFRVATSVLKPRLPERPGSRGIRPPEETLAGIRETPLKEMP